MLTFWAIVESTILYEKLPWLLFGQLLEKLGLLFILISGNAGPYPCLSLSNYFSLSLSHYYVGTLIQG